MALTILGISAFYHDAAACLLMDGEIIAAAQEERFTRKKHDQDFPKHAIDYCLAEGLCRTADISAVIFYDKPFLKFNRILETYLTFAPRGIRSFLHAIPLWMKEKIWLRDTIEKSLDYRGEILFSEHHESHAASAFFPSPFQRAAFLTIDGVGEYATSSFGVGNGNRIRIHSELQFPHSLGLLYSAFTYYTGFKVNSGEYKLMGLAPYGEPRYVQTIFEHLIDLKPDGSFGLNMEYFGYCTGLRMTNESFNSLFSGGPRAPEAPLTSREMDIAASIQAVTEEVVLRMARHVRKSTGERKLCMAGGVALNCVANGKLLRAGIFDDIWIQPAAGDAGGALGAAYIAHYHFFDQPVRQKSGNDEQKGSLLGREYSDHEIIAFLQGKNLPFESFENRDRLVEIVAGYIAEGKVVGWFQGRMEYGPRALGNRSILGDARNPEMQKRMNLKVKFRESFRPFAPAILVEEAGEWFDLERPSPYMLLIAEVKKDKRRSDSEKDNSHQGLEKLPVLRSEIPAVTHVDYSARIQTVDCETNPLFYALVKAFKKETGCPVIVNTSFNVRGEPIVESPADAYGCFMRTGMDVLVLGNCLLKKETQPPWEAVQNEKNAYEAD